MRRSGMTIREAAEAWVGEMSGIPTELIRKLIDDEELREVTTPSVGDRVYVFFDTKGSGDGEIVAIKEDSDVPFEIELDDGRIVTASDDEFEVEYDSTLPMWGTMWAFGDSADDYWLEEMDGIKIMSECGFRVYESDEFGYFFGIDGAGYDFYESHWVPLYKARGLQWHDPMTESGSFVMDEWRKADLYDGLLGYLSETISDSSELVSVLKNIGFSDEEIAFEGLEVIDDESDE